MPDPAKRLPGFCWCDAPEVSLLDYWPSGEFLLDTCCETRYGSAVEDMHGWPRAEWAAFFGAEAGVKVRQVATGEHVPSWLMDWGPRLVLATTKRERAAGRAPEGAMLRAEVRAFVASHHRHAPNTAPAYRWAYSVHNGAQLLGVATVGEPLAGVKAQANALGESWCEVTRIAFDHHLPPELLWNAASMVYGEAAREAKRRGFDRILTFTLEEEPGTSLRAAGWELVGTARARKDCRRRSRAGTPLEQPKRRWERRLSHKARKRGAA